LIGGVDWKVMCLSWKVMFRLDFLGD